MAHSPSPMLNAQWLFVLPPKATTWFTQFTTALIVLVSAKTHNCPNSIHIHWLVHTAKIAWPHRMTVQICECRGDGWSLQCFQATSFTSRSAFAACAFISSHLAWPKSWVCPQETNRNTDSKFYQKQITHKQSINSNPAENTITFCFLLSFSRNHKQIINQQTVIATSN